MCAIPVRDPPRHRHPRRWMGKGAWSGKVAGSGSAPESQRSRWLGKRTVSGAFGHGLGTERADLPLPLALRKIGRPVPHPYRSRPRSKSCVARRPALSYRIWRRPRLKLRSDKGPNPASAVDSALPSPRLARVSAGDRPACVAAPAAADCAIAGCSLTLDLAASTARVARSRQHRSQGGAMLAIAGTGYGLIGLLVIILLVVLIVYFARRA